MDSESSSVGRYLAAGFWGKVSLSADGKVEAYLPLAEHCRDVAEVFRALLDLATVRARLERITGCILDPVHLDRLAVIALLHDAGKANLGFQNKVFDPHAPRVGHIREIAPLLDEFADRTAKALEIDTLSTWFESPDALEGFLTAGWSHHGKPVRLDATDRVGNSERWWSAKAGRDPFAALAELMGMARRIYPAAFSGSASPLGVLPGLQHRFAGLVMLADWLGSHTGFFPIDRPDGFDTRAAARRALNEVGLNSGPVQSWLRERPSGFMERFGWAPYPLQAAITDPALHTESARLVIAEAETGSGKTEAALARFFDLFGSGLVDSLYFALPTRVAARELYTRILDYVRSIFRNEAMRPVVVLAVPGYAMADSIAVKAVLPDEGSRTVDSRDGRWRERAWAAERPKRFLAATIAVGTIDQALLSALQVPHAHLRSVCLDRALLVVDEVHASDAYMRRLLQSLLKHHLGVGGWAVLLSATLGGAARATLSGQAVPGYEAACAAPYPLLTVGPGAARAVGATGAHKHVDVRVRPTMWNPELIVADLVKAIRGGARVLVVMNTVARAIALQRALEECGPISAGALFRCRGVCCPHHGRFAPSDRAILDRAVSDRFGKQSAAGPVILIGTQTLEQSLDIDADLLVTDLCPMDVLLQRIGRLHRHARDRRPEGYASPWCEIFVPPVTDLCELLDSRGQANSAAMKTGIGSVYEDLRILQLTMDRLAAVPSLEIPADNRLLVEGATHPERLAAFSGHAWEKHSQNIEGRTIAARVLAEFPLLERVEGSSFGSFTFQELSGSARTRLGIDTLTVPLDHAVAGPFGIQLTEVTIPGHMAPERADDEAASVVSASDGTVRLSYGGRTFSYTRFGLEWINEPVA